MHDYFIKYEYRGCIIVHKIWIYSMHDYFIKYEYRACMIMNIKDAWLFHKDMNIELHACFINIEMHDWFMRYECWAAWLFNYHMLL